MPREYLKGKKVAHITTVHPVFDNRIFFKECVSLSQLGLDITLIASCEQDFEKDGVKVKAIQVAKQSRFSKVKRAYTLALDLDADIYHLHDPELLMIKPFLQAKGKLVVYDMHEHFSQQILIKPWIPSLLRKPLSIFFNIYERLLLGSGPVVFAEDDYVKHYPYVNDFSTVLNLPNLSKLQKISEDKFSKFICVGYLGGVTRARGCLKTLESLLRLKDQYGYKLGYVCIGRFESEAFKQELDALGKRLDYYFAPGYMAFNDAIEYIAKSHIGMALLDRTPNYINSYPTKIFEYMALGMPFLVSDFDINKEIVEQNECGYALPPESAEHLDTLLKELIDSERTREELGRNGKANVFKYSWNSQLNTLATSYQQWLAKK